MASTSTSSVQKSFKYDVFLSFRGEDVRKTFVDHLYHALHQKGIITYKDDEKIQKGERISEQLIRSIEDSRFYVIVFSRNYASSSWCLDELVKIMECQKMTEHSAYPIFYDVEPTEIRHQSGAVGEAFAKHIEKEDEDIWRDALKEAASLAGWELKNTVDGHEAKFIQKIVQEISLNSHFIYSSIDGKLVGMGTRVKSVVSSLEIDSNDVRIIGIKGIGGGGKTTLARAVFDHISNWFEGNGFVENVREVSKGSLSGLKELQKQMLSDVINDQSIVVTSVYDGKNKIKRMMPSRKALIVLDDVDDIDQLEALVGELAWFKAGSRIIITTRDEQVLLAHRVNFIHDVSLLSNEEAVCLFSRHAFGREIPNHGFEYLSGKVVQYAAGLPLTIKVLGSHLCNRSEPDWVDAIERLKIIPLDKTLKRLELSYNGLENDQKEIFLDVVCILKGESKESAIRMLKGCGFNAQVGLSVLEQKSLITISTEDGLGFHDHIEEMGWNIVRRLHPNEPTRHSRLWIYEEIEKILVNKSGTEATKSIRVLEAHMDGKIMIEGLRNMKELRLLYIPYVFGRRSRKNKNDRTSIYIPDALQSLHWHGYPFRYLVKTFKANRFWSGISQLREVRERKVHNNLKFIDLSYSNLKTFDLGMTPHLEELNLYECEDFVELKLPVKCLNLKVLNLSRSKVSKLNLGMIPHLERLYLEMCPHLKEFHASMECLKNLVYLSLSSCLCVEYFKVDKQHESAFLTDTVEIKVGYEDVSPLLVRNNSLLVTNNLPEFAFTCTYDEPRSSWSGNLEKLLRFGPSVRENNEYFLSTICDLQHIRKLKLEKRIHWDIWRLESLEKLHLTHQQFQHLPDSILMLKNLKSLQLDWCYRLEQLPENICRLECLKVLKIWRCELLRSIPNNICKMKCLKHLLLCNCENIKKLPEELGSLECLKGLWIEGTSINRLPQSIYQLKRLRIYGSRKQLESYGFTPILAGEILNDLWNTNYYAKL